MELNEIERIEAEAKAEESQSDQAAPGVAMVAEIDTADELAAFLDMAAKIAGHGLNAPTIPQRFTHLANVDIAKAAVDLCERYGIDARSVLIGQDSTLGAWLSLIVAIGLPGYAVYNDIKLAKAKEAKEAAADDDKQQSQ